MALTWNQVAEGDKYQYLNFVFYEPSLLDQLRGLHIPFAWIFHNKDDEPEAELGEVKHKKDHFHVLMDYGNTTSIRHWKRLLAGIPANDYAEITASPRGYFRYLIHEDDPSKFQYDKSERHCECGFTEMGLLSKTDTGFLIRWINHYILEHDICEYDDLVMCLDKEGYMMESMLVTRNTMHFGSFLKSRRIKKGKDQKEKAEAADDQIRQAKAEERREFNKVSYASVKKKKEEEQEDK